MNNEIENRKKIWIEKMVKSAKEIGGDDDWTEEVLKALWEYYICNKIDEFYKNLYDLICRYDVFNDRDDAWVNINPYDEDDFNKRLIPNKYNEQVIYEKF